MIGVNVYVVVGLARVLAPKIIVVFLPSLYVNFAVVSERSLQSDVNFGAKYHRNNNNGVTPIRKRDLINCIRSMMLSYLESI